MIEFIAGVLSAYIVMHALMWPPAYEGLLGDFFGWVIIPPIAVAVVAVTVYFVLVVMQI